MPILLNINYYIAYYIYDNLLYIYIYFFLKKKKIKILFLMVKFLTK